MTNKKKARRGSARGGGGASSSSNTRAAQSAAAPNAAPPPPATASAGAAEEFTLEHKIGMLRLMAACEPGKKSMDVGVLRATLARSPPSFHQNVTDMLARFKEVVPPEPLAEFFAEVARFGGPGTSDAVARAFARAAGIAIVHGQVMDYAAQQGWTA